MNNLTTAQRAELARIRVQLKAESKNELVRAVIGYMLKDLESQRDLGQKDANIAKLRDEAELADAFIKGYEKEFAAFVDARNAEVEAKLKEVDNQIAG